MLCFFGDVGDGEGHGEAASTSLCIPSRNFAVWVEEKSCKLLYTCLLSACGSLGGLWTPVTLNLCCSSICNSACSLSSELPAVLLPGPPSSPGEAFYSRGAVEGKGRSERKLGYFWFFYFLQSHSQPWDNVGQWQGKTGDIIGVAALCASGCHTACSTACFIFGGVAWGESYTLWI